MDLRKALDEPVSKFMSADFVSVPHDWTVKEAARAMQRGGTTEAVVTKAEKPVGIFTERDILYKVVAEGKDPSRVRVEEIMTSPIQTVEATSKAGDAIARMSQFGVRRLGITKFGKIVGMVMVGSVANFDATGKSKLVAFPTGKAYRVRILRVSNVCEIDFLVPKREQHVGA